MIFKNEQKPGTVSTELAIGISLAVVVLFVALGLFNDNLATMSFNSNMKNIFNGNTSKTAYTSFNRDYSNSQINVQIMGEQGLEMLRRKANNMMLDLIQKVFDGSDTSVKNANTIAYLSLAVNSMVGQPDVCTYMNKDSEKFCDEDGIGGYSYKVDYNGSSITLKKVDSTGRNILESKTINISSNMSNALSNSGLTPDADGRSPLSAEQKYEFIKNLSAKAESDIYSQDLLIKPQTTFKSTGLGNQKLKAAFKTFLDSVTNSADKAYTECNDHGQLIYVAPFQSKVYVGCEGYHRINNNDNSNIKSWASKVNSQIVAATTDSEIKSVFETSLNGQNIVSLLENDNINFVATNHIYNNPSTCEVFTTGLQSINNEYSLNISIPTCNPNGVKSDIVAKVAAGATQVIKNVADFFSSLF